MQINLSKKRGCQDGSPRSGLGCVRRPLLSLLVLLLGAVACQRSSETASEASPGGLTEEVRAHEIGEEFLASGIVHEDTGIPAVECEVTVSEAATPDHVIETTLTDESGEFRVRLISGRKYVVTAGSPVGSFAELAVRADEVPMSLTLGSCERYVVKVRGTEPSDECPFEVEIQSKKHRWRSGFRFRPVGVCEFDTEVRPGIYTIVARRVVDEHPECIVVDDVTLAKGDGKVIEVQTKPACLMAIDYSGPPNSAEIVLMQDGVELHRERPRGNREIDRRSVVVPQGPILVTATDLESEVTTSRTYELVEPDLLVVRYEHGIGFLD